MAAHDRADAENGVNWSKECKLQILSQNSFNFTIQIKVCGLGCCRIVADRFWNIADVENGDSVTTWRRGFWEG